MKKIYFLIVIIICFFYSVKAQEFPFKTQKSKEFNDKYKQSTLQLSEKNKKDDLIIVRSFKSDGMSHKQGFYIEYYNPNLELIKDFEFEITHPLSQKNNIVLGLFLSENDIQIVEFFYDIKEKAYICQTNIISEDFKTSKKELFRLKKEEIQRYGSLALEDIFHQRNTKIWSFTNSGDISSENDYSKSAPLIDFSLKNKGGNNITGRGSAINMIVNNDKSSFGIAIDFNSQKTEFLKVFLFDNRGTKKIDTIFKREVSDDKYFFQNIQISEDGNGLFLLAKTYADALNPKVLNDKYLFELTKITADSQKSVYIDPKEHFITKLKPYFHNGEIICLGFYSDINDYTYNGISYFKIDPNSLALLNEKYNPFTEQFIVDKYGKLKEKSLNNLVFRNVFFTKDNKLIVTAEEEIIYELQHTGISVTGSDTNYTFEDIITAKLNSDGELLWARNINKEQHTFDDPSFISYASTLINNDVYFFINASEKIKKLDNNRIEFKDTSKSNYNLNVIRINQKGDFEYKEILNNEENEIPFMVANGISIDNSMFFLGKKGSTKQLLKVTL